MASKVTKITLIGPGMCFGRAIIQDLYVHRAYIRGSKIVIHDINPVHQAQMTAAAARVCGEFYDIEGNSDLREALDGAEFVIISAAVNRNAMWRLDFEIPYKHSVKQAMGENGGPGSLFHGLRSAGILRGIVQKVREIAPKALVIILSNPESLLVNVLSRLFPDVRLLGLCHGFFVGQRWVADMMGMPHERVDILGAGLNHFIWFLQIKDSGTGEDLYPRFKAANAKSEFNYLARELMRDTGYWHSIGFSHTAEFLPWGVESDFHEHCVDEADAGQSEFVESMRNVLDPSIPLDPIWRLFSGEQPLPIITGILHNQKKVIPSAVVFNKNGYIPELRKDIAVEVPILVDTFGVRPNTTNIPLECAEVLEKPADDQAMRARAIIEGTKQALEHAFVNDCVISTRTGARAAFEELWNKHLELGYVGPCR